MSDRQPSNLLILGASTRAAAFSALRAGITPVCGDLFADADLCRVCQATAVASYPDGLEQISQASPPGPWMYTGALENHPSLVDRLAATRCLYGNSGETLRKVRNPFLVREVLQAAGFHLPDCRASAVGLPTDGSWLRKRLRSAGGLHVGRWHGANSEEVVRGSCYFQHFIAGMSCAAVYVSVGGQAQLLGVTEQLLADEFRYTGSVGPLRLNELRRAELERLGSTLANSFSLVGVWGVDFVWSDDGLWPIEINPRYTASMEIIERACGPSIVGLHIAACRDRTLPNAWPQPGSNFRWHGKQVVYAESDIEISPAHAARLEALNEGRSYAAVADLPVAGTSIRRGHPVCTVFAVADTRTKLMTLLKHRTEESL